MLTSDKTLDQGQAWWLRQEVQSDFFLDRTFPAYDPASSLARFQSFSPFNTPGYQSEEFDSLFENSLVAEDDERSEVLFRMQRLIEADAAVVPLAQPRNLWLVREGTVLPSFSPDGQLGDLAGFAAPT